MELLSYVRNGFKQKNWQKKESLRKYLKYLGEEYYEVYITLRNLFDEEGRLTEAVERLQYKLPHLSIYQISDVIENLDLYKFITAEYISLYVMTDDGYDLPCTEYTIKRFNDVDMQPIPKGFMKIEDSKILREQYKYDDSDIHEYYQAIGKRPF